MRSLVVGLMVMCASPTHAQGISSDLAPPSISQLSETAIDMVRGLADGGVMRVASEQECLQQLQLLAHMGQLIANQMPFSRVWTLESSSDISVRLRILLQGRRVHLDVVCQNNLMQARELPWDAGLPGIPPLSTSSEDSAAAIRLLAAAIPPVRQPVPAVQPRPARQMAQPPARAAELPAARSLPQSSTPPVFTPPPVPASTPEPTPEPQRAVVPQAIAPSGLQPSASPFRRLEPTPSTPSAPPTTRTVPSTIAPATAPSVVPNTRTPQAPLQKAELTAQDKATFAGSFNLCWTIAPFSGAAKTRLEVALTLSITGGIVNVQMGDAGGANPQQASDAFQAARTAISNCADVIAPLPQEAYDDWRVVTLLFDGVLGQISWVDR